MSRLCVILFGPPGSGKGTQAKLIRQCIHGAHISTGDMLREKVQLGDEVGRQVDALLKSGQLVPDDLVDRLVAERILREDCTEGFVLDGYPRTVPQAEVVDNLLIRHKVEPVVVFLKVDYNIIVDRLTQRRQCPNCKTIYNLSQNPPHVDGVCDNCGADLMVREDDREDVVRGRLLAYERQTSPVLEFFRSSGYRVLEVDGSAGAPQMIAEQICQRLAERVSGAGR